MGCPRFSDLSRKIRFIACSEQLTESRPMSSEPPVSSQLGHSPQSLSALTLLSSPSPADHAPSPAVLCRRAAPGHSCLSAALPTCMSSLCPRSPAQLSSRGGDFLLPTALPGDIHGPLELTAPARQHGHHCRKYFKVSSINQHVHRIPKAWMFQ